MESENKCGRWKGRLKEAFDMHDGFSEGSVYYGRTAAIMAAIIALSIVLHLI